MCAGLELAPFVRHRLVVCQDSDTLTPAGQFVSAAEAIGCMPCWLACPTISCSIIGGIPLNASVRRLEARLAV